jgi:inositol 1,4,5-triphosphate receptor type 3
MADAQTADSEEPLKIGDYVTLRVKRIHAFLSAEGILDQRVFVQTDPQNFDDCRYQICSPNQYSAARELADWEEKIRKEREKKLATTGGDELEEEKSLEEKSLQELLGGDDEEEEDDLDEDAANDRLRDSMERGKSSERDLNISTMKREIGNPVKFGDNYQLMHVKSGRFLTMSPKKIAVVEKQNMEIYLDEDGNSDSHFTILPKHKIDKAGDPVMSSHDIELMSTENRAKYLNYSQQEVPEMTGHREVNCALAAVTFAIFLYAEYKQPEDQTLYCSDIVRLRDPEKNALLRLLPLPSSTDGEAAQKDKDRYDLYLETQSEHSSQESNALWIIEAKHPHIGGEVEFASDPATGPTYRLRHLNTGRYVATRFNDDFSAKGAGARPSSRPGSRGAAATNATQYLCTTREIKAQKLTEITFANAKTQRKDVIGKKPVLSNHQPVQLCINGRFLSIGGQHEGLQQKFAEPGEYLYCCGASDDATTVLSLNVERADDDSTVIDALCGVCALPRVQAFANVVKKKQIKNVLHEMEKEFNELMSSLVNYLRGDPFSNEVDFKSRSALMPAPQTIQPTKQVFLREQAVLTEILDICQYLLDDFWKNQAPDLKVEIARMCFAVLLNAIASNSANQMHVADRLPVFIGHVATHFLASRCIVEMLEKNKQLQEDKVNDEAVGTFIEMIRTSKMKGEYLRLLQAVCSCKGKGVDDNQCMVAEQWLTEARELQIMIEADNRKVAESFSLFNKVWVPKELDAKSSTVGSDYCAGFEIYKSEKIPQVKISWVSDDPMLDPNALGGAQGKVPIEKVLANQFDDYGGTMTAAAVRIKKRVADYFIAQLNLAAEVCLDRNYVAIELCETTLPFDALFAILKTPELDPSLYAAIVRVITCIHVDRDPQTVLRVPRLSRILNEEPKQELELRMPFVDESRASYFALLQDTIEEQLSLSATQGDADGSEFDLRIMQLLKQLVKFRFYSKPDEVTKLITPLVSSLDQRTTALDFARSGTAGSSRAGTANSMTRTSSRQSMTQSGGGMAKKNAAIMPSDVESLDSGIVEKEIVIYPIEGHETKNMIYGFVDNIYFVAFIIILTLVGIILSFVSPNATVDLIFTVFFTIELGMRMYCYAYTEGPIGNPWDTMATFAKEWKEQKPPKFFHDGYAATDFWVVVLDLISTILMSGKLLEGLGFHPGTIARAARIMRVLKISKMLKAARFVGKVKELNKTVDMTDWVLPNRYAQTGVLKMETMLETVDILREITNSTRDFSMSLLLSKWQQWDLGQHTKKPDQLFTECYDQLKQQYTLALDSNMEDFDLVFLDLCLYKYPELVQSALNVLMIHHNLRSLMLDDVTHSQLLVKPQDEAQGIELRGKLADLQSCAEQAELWAELKKPEDRKINLKVKTILRELADKCRTQTSKLSGSELYRPDAKFQNLLRNLGAFEVAMTVLELEQSLDGDDDEDDDESAVGDADEAKNAEVQENTREILRLCNMFLAWFVKHNPKNQELAFTHLDIFTDYLPGGFGASKIVSEIFRGNDKLVKQFPPKLYGACADLLVKDNNPDILDVFEALMWMPQHDAPNNYQVQKNIFGVITDPNRVDKIKYLCDDPEGDEYAERLRFCQDAAKNLQQMAADGSIADDEYGHMPRPLAYHVKLLQVLSGTAIGSMSITEIEAKLQTMYGENDVCAALLDERSTLDILIPLAQYFYYAIIEVEIAVAGLGKNKLVWRFLVKCVETLKEVLPSLEYLQTHYRDASPDAVAARKKALYATICAQIIGGFFEKYYKPEFMDETFTLDDEPEPDLDAEDGRFSPGLSSLGDDVAEEEEETHEGSAFGVHQHMWWHDVIADLQHAISEVYSFQCKVFSADHYRILFEAIDQCVLAMDDDTRSQLQIARPDDLESICESVEQSMAAAGEEDLEPKKAIAYGEFMEAIQNSESIQKLIAEDKDHMVKSLQKIPSFADPVDEDLRLEPLIQKLVDHTRSRLIFEGDHSKYLDPDCTKSTKWFINLFRLMIEDKWGMDIYARDDDGDDTQDKAAASTQMMLDKFGATTLCVDLISAGIDSELVLECIKLLVALLFKEGGATEVQTTIFKHLNQGRSELFFEELEDIMDKMLKYYQNEKNLPGIEPEDAPTSMGEVTVAELPPEMQKSKDGDDKDEGGGDDDEDELPDPLDDIPIVADNIITVRFMQLLCEGHFHDNQEILRKQKNNSRTLNTLAKMVKFMQELSKGDKQCRASTAAATALGDLILEVIQGPCVGNQEFFADSELIEILNRIMRNKTTNDCDQDEEDDLKAICLNILEALCEGQLHGSKIYERILSVIDLEVLRVMILSGDHNEELNDCQTEALVLLQMFFDYKPELRDQVALPERINKMMGKDVTSVEVIWHNQLQRRFFSKPPICANLAKATRDDLVVQVNRNSLEEQLGDFVTRCHDVYLELLWQDYLENCKLSGLGKMWSEMCEYLGLEGLASFGPAFSESVKNYDVSLAKVFSRTNQNRATWVAFGVASTINLIMLVSFKKEPITSAEAFGPNSPNWSDEDDDNPNPSWDDSMTGDEIVGFGYTEDMKVLPMANKRTGSLGFEGHRLPVRNNVIKNVIFGMNLFNITLSTFTLILFLVVRVPVKVKSLLEKDWPVWQAVIAAVSYKNWLTLYYFAYTFVALLAMIHSPVWQGVLLLDIIVKDTTTRAVLLAVILPIKQLTMTFLLAIFVIYIFAFWVFTMYSDDFLGGVAGLENSCETLGGCLIVTFDYGIRLSGGIGDFMKADIGARWYMDVLYFVVVLVILLNVVFGIIIDTFSELRSDKNERLTKTTNFCFICGIDKLKFDRASDGATGFKDHITHDHYMWDYLFFIVFIWLQDKDDDDGLEYYVRDLIDNEDIKWFPMNKAMVFDENDNEDESLTEQIASANKSLESMVTDQSTAIRESLESANNMMRVCMEGLADLNTRITKMEQNGIKTTGGGGGGGGGGSFASGDAGGEEKTFKVAVPVTSTKPAQAPVSSQAVLVQVVDAMDLVKPHLLGSTDPFVSVSLFWNGSKVGDSETIWFGTEHPQWKNEARNTFTIPITSVETIASSVLVAEVNHAHRRGAGQFLGCCQISGADLMTYDGQKQYYKLGKKSGLGNSKQAMVQGSLALTVEIKT